MKKLLTLLFAVALTVSMSGVSFAQDSGMDKDKTDKKEMKKEEKKEKKMKKEKKAKKEKKDDMKQDDGMAK